MVKNIVIILFCFVIDPISAPAQCLRGDSLVKRINFLKDTSKLSATDQIKALTPYEKAIATCRYNHDSVHAQLLQRLGNLYSSVLNYPKAIDYYLRSVVLINRNTGHISNNSKDLIKSYYWLAAAFESMHRISDQMAALDSCASISTRLHSVNVYCLWSLLQRAKYSYDVGDYHRCINYTELCESVATEFANSSKQSFDLGMWYAMSSLEWNVNALLLLKKYDDAESILKKKANECQDKRLQHNLGFIYGTLAEVLELKGEFENVLFYQDKAFAIEQKLGTPINCKAMLDDVGYAVWFKHYKNLNKALEYYTKALNYKVNDSQYRVLNSLQSLRILDRIANVYTARGKYDDALKYVQLAFDQIKPGTMETEMLHSSLDQFISYRRLGYIATLVVDKGAIYQHKYEATGELNDIKEAVRIYRVADQFLERIKTEQSDVRSKLFWRTDTRRLYELAIDACHSYGNLDDAFYFFERSRAMLLYDELSQLRLMNQEDVARQTLLKKSITDLEAQVAKQDKQSDRSRQLQEQLMMYRQDLDRLNEQINSRNPVFYQHLSQTEQIDVHEVQQKLLKKNDRLLEFFHGDSAVYTLTISPGNVFLEKINKDSFDRSATQFVSYVSNYELLNKHFGEFASEAYQLYQLIFSHHNLPPGKLIVSFDGHYFPVEALVIKKGLPPTYLVQEHAVSYAHSARLLMIDFGKASESGMKSFLGMAPVNFQKQFSVSSLIGSDLSLNELRSNFRNPNCLAYQNASKNNFLQEFPAYQVIQLYTHASDGGSAGQPEIYFADSVLRLSELMAEKKPVAKLIVLSACETGTGQLYEGEGVFSFNRGFAALGIPSSVSNLWSVDNVSMYRLTELFYKYLTRGMPMDEALQKAKLEFMQESPKEKSLPYYWAATILAGKTNPLEFRKPITWASLVFLTTLILGLSVFGYLLIRKKNMIRHNEK